MPFSSLGQLCGKLVRCVGLFFLIMVDIQYSISLRYTVVIQYLCALQNDHHDKSSYICHHTQLLHYF